jgi:phosphoribosylanthranilate isomerase
MRRVRVKICGIRRPQDLQAAVAAGADALGFVFAPGSPRILGVDEARVLAGQVPAFVSRVGLFMDQTQAEVEQVLAVCEGRGDGIRRGAGSD